jgi:hypothetical protein
MSYTVIPNEELLRTIKVLRYGSHPQPSPHADHLESLMANHSQPYTDPRSGYWTYSIDGEYWHNEDLGEFLRNNPELKAGDLVYRGVIAYQDPASFIDPQVLLGSMNENASATGAGEWVDRWPSPPNEATEELVELLSAWARKHCSPNFYLIPVHDTYALTVDDILCRESAVPVPPVKADIEFHFDAEGDLQAGAAPQVAAPVPPSLIAVPSVLPISADDMAALVGCMGDKQDGWDSGTLYIGSIDDGRGGSVFGLHVSNDECPEEGMVTIAKFDPRSPDCDGIVLSAGLVQRLTEHWNEDGDTPDGAPTHGHTVRGRWDGDRRNPAGSICKSCADHDAVRQILAHHKAAAIPQELCESAHKVTSELAG